MKPPRSHVVHFMYSPLSHMPTSYWILSDSWHTFVLRTLHCQEKVQIILICRNSLMWDFGRQNIILKNNIFSKSYPLVKAPIGLFLKHTEDLLWEFPNATTLNCRALICCCCHLAFLSYEWPLLFAWFCSCLYNQKAIWPYYAPWMMSFYSQLFHHCNVYSCYACGSRTLQVASVGTRQCHLSFASHLLCLWAMGSLLNIQPQNEFGIYSLTHPLNFHVILKTDYYSTEW
jgi:hypothetical protein